MNSESLDGELPFLQTSISKNLSRWIWFLVIGGNGSSSHNKVICIHSRRFLVENLSEEYLWSTNLFSGGT